MGMGQAELPFSFQVGVDPKDIEMESKNLVHNPSSNCRRVLVDTADILVVGNFCQNSETIVFTFGDMISPADEKNAWGEAPAIKYGADIISFMSRNRDWFPAEIMRDPIDKVRNATHGRYETRITYGGSMGGYAAIRYSAELRADKVVALVPQFSIDPDVVPDYRYNKYFKKELHHQMAPDAGDVSGNVLLASDPSYAVDEQHIRLYEALLPNAQRLPLYNTEHNATALLASSSFFKCLMDYPQNPKDIPGLVSEARFVMKSRHMYYRLLVRKLARRRPKLIESHLEIAKARPDEDRTLFDRAILDHKRAV